MADKKIYTIQINGISESTKAVDALNKQLEALEARIKALESKNIKINSNGGGNAKSSLDEEAKLEKQIEQIDAKRKAYSKEIYQNYLAAKDVLDETVKDQQQIAASERLQANNYSNTMQGLKQELKDLKTVMQTTDLGDEKFGEMSKRAGELTEKLKQLEEAYGQYGRNVGNYANGVAEGLQKVKVNVGGTVREFDNARQASKTLNNELKAMAVNGQQNTVEFKNLQKAVMEMESTMRDAKKPMDNIMDSMESVMAIANVGQGIRGLFGIDDAEMQKSIKNLVALQNILKGIETINKQIKTGEGIGGWIKPFTTQVDKAIVKLTSLQTTMKGVSVASKTMTIALKAATVALKAFKVALTFGISIAIDLVLEKVLEMVDKFKEANSELKQMEKVQEEGAKAYAEAASKIALYKQRIDSFVGTKKQEKKLVEELNSSLGDEVGQYKTLGEWQKRLDAIGKAYAETMMLEAEKQALLNLYTEAYINLKKTEMAIANGDYKAWYRTEAGDRAVEQEEYNKALKKTKDLQEEVLKKDKEIDSKRKEYGLGTYSIQIDKDTEKTVKKVEEELVRIRINTMRAGFARTLAELKYERNKRIQEAKESGYKIGEQIKLAEESYQKSVLEATIAYHEKLLNEQESFNKEMQALQNETYNRNIDTSKSINARTHKRKREEIPPTTANYFYDDTEEWVKHFTLDYNSVLVSNKKLVDSYIDLKNNLMTAISAMNAFKEGYNVKDIDGWLEKVDKYSKELYEFTTKYPEIAKEAENTLSTDITDIYVSRIYARKEYFVNVLELTKEEAKKELEIEKEKIDTEIFNLQEAEKKRHKLMSSNIFDSGRTEGSIGSNVRNLFKQYDEIMGSGKLKGMNEDEIATYFSKFRVEMDKWLDDLDEKVMKGEVIWEDYLDITQSKLINGYKQLRADFTNEFGVVNEKEVNKGFVKFFEQVQGELKNHENTMLSIKKSGDSKLEDEDDKYRERMQKANADYFHSIEHEYSEFLNAINNIIDKSERTNSFGFINIKTLGKTMKQAKDAVSSGLLEIEAHRNDLLEKLKKKEISFDDFLISNEQLDNLKQQFKDTYATIEAKTSEFIDKFVGQINQYFQTLGQSIMQIMQAVWDYQDYLFDKEQDELEKENEELEKKLDKQEEIVEKHKDAINSIEDELATSRGDRRQHLIDQLNAEIEAQRKAQAEEKRIQKEKEANEKRQEELEKKRRKEEYERNVKQAFISWHMSISNGLATQPFMPLGIAMGALATVLGGVQYALVKSQKPYAKGGQLDGGVASGPRHSQGGIPVLGGRASIEGGEFITNRQTTAKNIDLLEYINSKKKKVDINDLIEFYGTTPKKTLRAVRTKFEDGGYLPTLPNDLDIKDQLQNIVVNQDNRPIYVSVVDINNKQDDVRRVQTLAGL